jgi:deferrochelatase/peroxidase EfeB
VDSGEHEHGELRNFGVTRRGVLAAAALLGIGAGLDHFLADIARDSKSPRGLSGEGTVPFYAAHQAGIATPAPEFLSFAAFDVTTSDADGLRFLLQGWTGAAVSLTSGEAPRRGADKPAQAPTDPGEAIGLGPARLTITVGFGPSLFGVGGPDRFGFAVHRPLVLSPLPAFRGENLDPDRSDGDLCVQACADDPQVAFHAIHVLTRLASGAASLRWTQTAFGRTSSTSRSQLTPRNLMGFKDGTNNVRGDDTEETDEHVWVQPGDGPEWMEGGSYLVARRIKMLLDVWDATSLEGQERAIGREKLSGAPLGQGDEYDLVNLDAHKEGEPLIPVDAHIRLSSPETNDGLRILRRGYSFSEPSEAGSGEIDAGLFFISFQRDPLRQFVPIQRRLSESDALNRHILHTGSAVFACPPGVKPGGFLGEGLFA